MMKYTRYLFLTIILFLSANSLLAVDIEVIRKKLRDNLLEKTTIGKDFWVAIPPNEDKAQNIGIIAIEIYITSQVDTKVNIELGTNGQVFQKNIKALEIVRFSTRDGELPPNLEIYDSEVIQKKSIHIYSDDPVSVFVLSSKVYSTDGYLAIPSEAWGKEYRHVSYYDYWVYKDRSNFYRGGGFVIIAKENNTKVKIALKGKGDNSHSTVRNRKLGDTLIIPLDKGETYMIMGNGVTRGRFDLSGSEITSDKDIGLISYHTRTTIPSNEGSIIGADHLSEMIPPISSWGKKYTTIEFKRRDKGDYFRIISAYDSTNWTLKYYDLNTGSLLGEQSGFLEKAGDFYEYNQIAIVTGNPDNQKSIRGASVWEADKSVLLMQYSYSLDWDGEDNFDPFMTIVVPEEQFTNATVFQTPDLPESFTDHYFNILAIGDSTDKDQELLKTLTLDGINIWKNYPSFLQNRITGTNYYWARVRLNPGAHKVMGKARFGGYIYGFGLFNSYGWPAVMMTNLFNIDTLQPSITKSQNCGDLNIIAEDKIEGERINFTQQIDLGIAAIELLDDSYNYTLNLLTDDTLEPGADEFEFEIIVIDRNEKAFAKFAVIDMAGNIYLDSIAYDPNIYADIHLQLSPHEIEISPGDKVKLDFLAISSNFQTITFDNLFIRLKFLTHELQVIDSVEINPQTGWNLDEFTKEIARNYTYLNLSLSGEKLVNDSLIFTMLFDSYLSDSSSYHVLIDSIAYSGEFDCTKFFKYDADFKVNTCVKILRDVIVSQFDYSLTVNPNPGKEKTLNIDYEIGIDGYTEIKLYNIMGEEITSLVNSYTRSGKYSKRFNLKNLGTGTYLLIFSSGQYKKFTKVLLLD